MTIDNDIMQMTQEDMVDEIMGARAALRKAREELFNNYTVTKTGCDICESYVPRDPDGVPADDLTHKETCIIAVIDAMLPKPQA